MRFYTRTAFLSFLLCTLYFLNSCGSSAGGGGGHAGGGQALGGSSPGIRGAGFNTPGDPVRPGTGGIGGGGAGGSAGGGGGTGGGGGSAGNTIPADAIEVDIEVPPRGSRVDVSFNGATGSGGLATLLINITNPQNQPTGGLSMQSLTFSGLDNDFLTESFVLVGGGTLVHMNDSPLKTLAVLLNPPSSRNVNPFTYPTRGRDLPLSVAQYLQRIVFPNVNSGNFTGRLVLKNDDSFQNGTLKVNVFLDGQDARNFTNDILESLDIWRAIYNQAGIFLDIASVPRPNASSNLPVPTIGSAMYEAASQSIPNRQDAVNVFIASSIGDTSSTPSSVLGISGGIPGAHFPSVKSAVVVSLNAHTGIDGNLNPARRRVLAETIAHEVGHFLGLFHPVEIDRSQTNAFHGEDPLGDTQTCTTITECAAIGLVSNLMFPTAVGNNTIQQILTPEQADVLNIQPLVQ